MKTNQQFILDTLLPYKVDPSTCAVSPQGGCEYLTKEGKKCAVGKHMKKGKWQQYSGYFANIKSNFNVEEVLTKNALKQNLSDSVWITMQEYHDTIARNTLAVLNNSENINAIVDELEKITELKFSELRYTSK